MVPAAPWRSVIDAVFWAHPAAPEARGTLPPQLAGRAGLPVTVGGLVSYREGPVGPYDEIAAAPLLLRPLRAHVPFIAVDSEPSIAGGRGNWALPKVLASFDGEVGRPGRSVATGDGWALSVTATARARRLPFGGRSGRSAAQPRSARLRSESASRSILPARSRPPESPPSV
ncbi:MAG: acetoacetate decarboxylase family protein [Actinobacteria bacterium]|nr:acetoacetate decarboxylase family protein [Actinomycetota bacterium]